MLHGKHTSHSSTCPKVLPTKNSVGNENHEVANGGVLDARYLLPVEVMFILDGDEFP